MFTLLLLTPANIAKIRRISASLLRLNYFYVWGRIGKTKLLQRLNMEVVFENWIFNRLIFNIKYLQSVCYIKYYSYLCSVRDDQHLQDERKPRPFIFTDWTGAKLLKTVQR